MPIENLVLTFGAVVLGVATIALLLSTFFTVEQRTTAIVQRLGKFMREVKPGIHAKIPLLDRVVGRINLRVQQLDVKIETKTQDNVFVQMVVAVQYFVLPEKVYDAFYKLDDAQRQITSYVFDVVRAQVPKIVLDDVFEKKDEIANAVRDELAQVMEGFGYGILKTLVTDIDPDPKVKESMNEINAAQRMRVAATERGRGGPDPQGQGSGRRRSEQGLAGPRHRRSTAGHRRRPARLGGRVQEVCSGHDGEGRDESRTDDPVLRHAEGDRSVFANERDSHPSLAGEPHEPDRADAQCHDRGGSDGQGLGCADGAAVRLRAT